MYSRHQIILHWLTALLILAMAATGMAYSAELGGKGVLTAHQIIGQALIVVVALRLIARFFGPTPPQHAHPAWQRVAAKAVHAALYLVMLAYLVTGYVSASALRGSALLAPVGQAFARSDMGEILLEMHFALKWVLLALVIVHVAAALKHHFWDRDATLRSMTFPGS